MVIISNKPGQLGNRLFIFSHWMAYAVEHDEVILNPAFDEYASYFKGTCDQKISRYPRLEGKSAVKEKSGRIFKFCYYFARILHRLNIRNRLVSHIYLDWEDRIDLEALGPLKTRFLFVQGWIFRAKNWLKLRKDNILPMFELVEPYQSNVENYISDLRSRFGTVVGIHIRRGDYETFEGGRFFYSLEQYKKQISNLYDQLCDQDPVFLICSNEKVDMEIFDDLPCVSGPGHFIEDMYALSNCDYITGPPSTFTMWASYYGDVPLNFIRDARAISDIADFSPYPKNK